MFYKIVVIAAIALVSLEASAQRTIIIDGKVLQLNDTVGRSRASVPMKPLTTEQLAALLKSKSMFDSASAPKYKMTVVRPDMKSFSTFPAVDPTKKPGYVPDDMPNGLSKSTIRSARIDAPR